MWRRSIAALSVKMTTQPSRATPYDTTAVTKDQHLGRHTPGAAPESPPLCCCLPCLVLQMKGREEDISKDVKLHVLAMLRPELTYGAGVGVVEMTHRLPQE
ncbi:unnamed protein product [Pleuronectes platessa]|uniref:Uncharacterized protein n=1 Tax=Pleuronectes platessa TaxID=8262 RepID=A0A9N7TUB2_PLEPL|nr:unnamed protein product [Pleuronectes platessa]